jgi:hypothetical protein
VHVDFVIKFLHGIIAWDPSDSEQCYFEKDLKRGELDYLFSIEQLAGRGLFSSGMSSDWM